MEIVKREIEEFKSLEFLLKHLDGHEGFIAGGCFKNIFNKEEVKDIDIFFENRIEMSKALNYFKNSELYEDHYKNNNVEAFKEVKTGTVVELIKKTFGTPEEILSKFDFTVTKFCLYKEKVWEDEDGQKSFVYNEKIIHQKSFFEHLFFKRLVIDGKYEDLDFPEGTFNRMIKYSKYGYYPCRETKIKIMQSIANGVDSDHVRLSNDLYEGMD